MKNGRLVLITGGARSGKSSFAVDLAGKLGDKVLYVATAEASDPEMKARISSHGKSRPAHWKTFEVTYDLEFSSVGRFEIILLDCLTLLVTNLLLEIVRGSRLEARGLRPGENFPVWEETETEQTWGDLNQVKDVEDQILNAVVRGIKGIQKLAETVIVVTNEVGLGIVPSFPLGRLYRDVMGGVNRKVAEIADEVYFVVSGMQMKVKGG